MLSSSISRRQRINSAELQEPIMHAAILAQYDKQDGCCMKIFVAAAYSSKVNYDTGEVFPEYKAWLEDILVALERAGYEVVCSLREDKYRINDGDPAGAFKLDAESIKKSDMLLALLDGHISAGVQTEIGYALALDKKIYIAHLPSDKLAYINRAMIEAGLASELLLPLDMQAISGGQGA